MTTLPSSERIARIIFNAEQKYEGKDGSFDKLESKRREALLAIASDVLVALYKVMKK